jgi:hypothetical protein
MLHVCVWDEDDALIVDVVDETAARAAALEEVGSPPRKVTVIPVGLFGVRVGWEEDKDEPDVDVMVLEALPHVVDVIGAIEDAALPEELAIPIALAPVVLCTAEADGPNDEPLRCELATAHGPTVKHRCGDFEW